MSDLIKSAPKTEVSAETAKEILKKQGPVTVMVELKEDPVAVVKARNGGSLSESEEKQIQDNLGKAQEKVAAQVAVLGGTVENRLQSAYNGLRVTIDSGQLANVEAIDGVKSVQAIPEQERSNTKSVPYIGAPNVWQGAGGSTTPTPPSVGKAPRMRSPRPPRRRIRPPTTAPGSRADTTSRATPTPGRTPRSRMPTPSTARNSGTEPTWRPPPPDQA